MRMGSRLATVTLSLLLAVSSASAELRSFGSRHYLLHTDIDSSLTDDLARRMDAMYDEYSRRLIRFDDAGTHAMADVYLYNDRDDYVRFVGPSMRSTGGVFIPSRNALAAVLETQGRDSLRRTLQHEAFHQFAAETIRYPLPMWVNEGIAQYFEEGLWTGEGFIVGQVPPRRWRQLQTDLKSRRVVDFEAFAKMTPEEWSKPLGSRFASDGATQYNQAWAMVHFLLNADDSSGKPLHPRFVRMLDLIHRGVDPSQAFERAFSANYKGFGEMFRQWAANVQVTEEAEYIENQGVLADMLVAMDGYQKHFDDVASFRRAVAKIKLEIHYSKGMIKWGTDKETDRYFSRRDGKLFGENDLYFQSRRNAPLPDLVCRCLNGSALRTRFYKVGDRIEHELFIEPLNPQTGRPMASPLLQPRVKVSVPGR